LRLGALPTQAGDDSPLAAVKLFGQFLTLADYADLRAGPAGGSDALVDVFAESFPTATAQLAALTPPDPQVVRDIAQFFLTGNPQLLANNKGIRRLWQALQLIQLVGIPVTSLTACTAIVSLSPPAGSPPPNVLAANLRNAVQAKYTPDNWRPIAQSVF